MAQQLTESLSRTFVELRSKSEKTQRHAAYELHNQVVRAARGK